MATDRPRINWSDAPIVFIVIPTCPACGCHEYRRTKTAGNGDGSKTRKVVCRACELAYKIAIELPEPGNQGPGVL